MYEIEIYEDKNGSSEVIEYFEKLQNSKSKEDRIKANKIRMYMKLLSEYGFMLNEPYIKKLCKEIWELRPLNDRFLFTYRENNKFMILSHFIKKTQKIPQYEIEKAKRILEDLKERGKNNEQI